ncbi:hypothetical protein ACFV7Q_01090 [Streptomyces sp. NPDC059851]|uniref:hypothetical protein n=1 Tax=Streptomyces sp. NPDC059851 TaxID=3346971 RepID=UPI0036574C27
MAKDPELLSLRIVCPPPGEDGAEVRPTRWDCEVEGVWALRSEPDRIHVVLIHPRARTGADRPWIQVGLTLAIFVDAPSGPSDPADRAEHLEARLTAGDTRATAEVWGGSHDAEQLGYPWPPVLPSHA